MADELEGEDREALLRRVRKLQIVNDVLMRRVEQSMDMHEDAFLLFQTATSLESKIQQRTASLNAALAELAATNQALAKARDAANAANVAKSVFLANMSHELRTPLHAILSFAGFGMREAGDGERENLKEYFRHVYESGETLVALLNDLLDLAKLESGRMRYEWDAVDVGDVVNAVGEEFYAACRERNIVLAVDVPEAVCPIRGDALRLRQVLRNLTGNAVRYTRTRVSLSLACDAGARVVRVTIGDDGPGIPEAELEQVFEMFVQSSATKSGAGGTGLGLAITREIVGAHAGRVWAANRPEGGAVLTVELPLLSDELQAGEPEAAA